MSREYRHIQQYENEIFHTGKTRKIQYPMDKDEQVR